MPKIGQTVCVNKKAHFKEIKELLELIAIRWGKSRGDVVIAYEEDISVYAVRMWLTRPIPKRHWKTVAKLSGLTLDKIQQISTQHFTVK